MESGIAEAWTGTVSKDPDIQSNVYTHKVTMLILNMVFEIFTISIRMKMQINATQENTF